MPIPGTGAVACLAELSKATQESSALPRVCRLNLTDLFPRRPSRHCPPERLLNLGQLDSSIMSSEPLSGAAQASGIAMLPVELLDMIFAWSSVGDSQEAVRQRLDRRRRQRRAERAVCQLWFVHSKANSCLDITTVEQWERTLQYSSSQRLREISHVHIALEVYYSRTGLVQLQRLTESLKQSTAQHFFTSLCANHLKTLQLELSFDYTRDPAAIIDEEDDPEDVASTCEETVSKYVDLVLELITYSGSKELDQIRILIPLYFEEDYPQYDLYG